MDHPVYFLIAGIARESFLNFGDSRSEKTQFRNLQ